MSISLFILSIGSIFIGYITKDMFIGMGTNFWNTSIFNLNNNITVLNGEFMPFHIKLMPLYFSFLGSFFIYYNNYLFIKYNFFKIFLKYKWLYIFLIKKWYFDIVYNKFFVLNTINLGFFTFKEIDRGLIEIIGPLGITRALNIIISKLTILRSGYLYHYLFLIIISILVLLLFWSSLILFFDYNVDIRFYLINIFIIIFFCNNKYFKIK
jgi:NADH-ubiquinone oxidoreductase chain 5